MTRSFLEILNAKNYEIESKRFINFSNFKALTVREF